MPNILCDNPPSRCEPGVFLNLSSELPESCIEPNVTRYNADGEDINYFLGRRLVIVEPPLGSQWLTNQFLGHCISAESQVAADICSYTIALECLFGATFPNQEVSCTVECPDGGEFVFTVPAGEFAGLSQEEANLVAMSYACQQAEASKMCLSDLNVSCCTGTAFEGTIFAS
jgi:hypothetical protein